MASLGEILRMFATGLRRAPIRDETSLVEFLQTRSAQIAQLTLYGYLKARMGTRYREQFMDDRMAAAIAEARLELFAACLSDVTIHALALTAEGGRLGPEAAARAAVDVHSRALAAALAPEDLGRVEGQACERFAGRARSTDWEAARRGEAAFTLSPATLSAVAPVSDEFRALDREIVVNSVRFHWRDVRAQLRRRLDAEAVAAALSGCCDGPRSSDIGHAVPSD